MSTDPNFAATHATKAPDSTPTVHKPLNVPLSALGTSS